MQRCPGCGTIKALSEFGKDRTKPSGLSSHCRDCKNRARRGRYNAKLGHERQRSRDYYRDNREAVLARQSQQGYYQEWKARNPDGLWKQWLKKAHDMQPEQWYAMLAEQDGRCYICERELPENRTDVAIDHDHDCCGPKRSCRHCRRGLAHDRCNTWVGMLGEDVELMRRALSNFEQAKALVQAVILTKPEQGALALDLASGE